MMLAIVTSIGEPTTELCCWALERNGFEVKVIQNRSTLWAKLRDIYDFVEDDFVRVDADVIVNRNCSPINLARCARDDEAIWWLQFLTWGWFQQNITHGGVQFIRKEALPHLRNQILEAEDKDRPESYMYRIKPFHDPRRCVTNEAVMGMHGWGQTDLERVKQVKRRRMQYDNYDWDLVEKLSEFEQATLAKKLSHQDGTNDAK